MRELVVMRGLPGSGKSHRAQEIKRVNVIAGISCELCSTDDYWLRPDKTYDFNYDLVSNAHMWNQRSVRKFMEQAVRILSCPL